MKEIYTKEAPEPIGPYSQAVLSGNLLFISGQIGINSQNSDFREQVQTVFNNIGHILAEASMNFGNVLKVTVFIKKMENFPILNEIYATNFEKPYPAREVVEVSALPQNADVEISLIASK